MIEYQIDWRPGYRVYFGRDGDALVILLTGGARQRQQEDIEPRRPQLGGITNGADRADDDGGGYGAHEER